MVLDPAVSYQQNRVFKLVGNGGFRYPYQTLDWPQQPRLGSFWTFAPGQSVIALQAGAAKVALSTENLWWGPARRYPILLSNTALGFPHLRLGTSRTVDIGFAKLDLDLLWGRLDESGQFDAIVDNNYRLFTGVFLELRPAFAHRVGKCAEPAQEPQLHRPRRRELELPEGDEPRPDHSSLVAARSRALTPESLT